MFLKKEGQVTFSMTLRRFVQIVLQWKGNNYCMLWGCLYFCHIFMKLEFSRQIFYKYRISWKGVPWKSSYSVWMDRQTDRQTDMTKWIVANPNFAHTPKHIPLFFYMMPCKLVYSFQLFQGFCSLHLQARISHPNRWYLYIKLHCVLAQKTGTFISIVSQPHILHVCNNITAA